jgi:hypothetical protein
MHLGDEAVINKWSTRPQLHGLTQDDSHGPDNCGGSCEHERGVSSRVDHYDMGSRNA